LQAGIASRARTGKGKTKAAKNCYLPP